MNRYETFVRFDKFGNRVPDRIADRPHVPTPVRDDYVSRQTYRLACRLAKKGRVQS